MLRIYPWSETSLIASLFTCDFGKLSVIAKGARRPKSSFEAALDLLSICRVVFISKSSDALDILTEAKLQRRFRAGEKNLLRLYAGYYTAELLDHTIGRGDKHTELYELAQATLEALHESSLQVAAIVLRFEMQLLRLTGHLPSWRDCAHCGRDAPADKGFSSFSMLGGGVLCSNCVAGAQQIVRLPTAVLEILEQHSQVNWRSTNLTAYGCTQPAVLRGVVQRYFTVLLDRKLQMHSYLEELGR